MGHKGASLMRVALLGYGGREHALAFCLSRDPAVDEILVLPGNAGMEKTAKVTLLPVTLEVGAGLVRVIKALAPDLVIVGPEAPLCDGIVDLLIEQDIPVLGPTKNASAIEGSKEFCKVFMEEFEIPTAEFKVFHDAEAARAFVNTRPWNGRLVIKASSLAQGKGVVVSDDLEEQLQTIENFLLNPSYPVKTKTLVIEQTLTGVELSAFALCDGEDFIYLGEARDHKRLLDGDQGPNTGGMGCYAHHSMITDEQRQRICDEAIAPVLKGMKERGHPYRGFLFAGLMIDGDELKVLEYNARFGDPEAQTLLPLISGAVGEVFLKAAQGRLRSVKDQLVFDREHYSVHVVMASKNYPGLDGNPLLLNQTLSCEELLLSHKLNTTFLFSAGLAKKGDRLVNSGGRVLGVTALASSFQAAREQAYENMKKIHFEGAFYRKDIALREL
jgi:phosphoribosylamine---glycine ligase